MRGLFASRVLGRIALTRGHLNGGGYDGAGTEPGYHYSYTKGERVGVALASLMLRMPLMGCHVKVQPSGSFQEEVHTLAATSAGVRTPQAAA